MQPAIGILKSEPDSPDPTARRHNLDVRIRLSLNDYDQCLRAVEEVTSCLASGELFSLIPSNLEELDATIAVALEAWTDKSERPAVAANIRSEVNRRILNFLTSARSYLDHTETALHRRRGPDSPVTLRFKSIASAEYDASFAYRFSYRLRNYSQHCGFPASIIQFAASRPPLPGDPIHYSLLIAAARDNLVAEFDWGPLQSEVASQPAAISLLPILHSFMASLETIHSAVATAELPLVRPSAVVIAQWLRRIEPIDGEPYLLRLEGRQDTGGRIDLARLTNVGLLPLPIRALEAILDADGDTCGAELSPRGNSAGPAT